MKKRPIKTAPKDKPILLHFPDEGWIEAEWYESANLSGYWDVISMPSHGCGCCSYKDPDPDFWLPLPD